VFQSCRKVHLATLVPEASPPTDATTLLPLELGAMQANSFSNGKRQKSEVLRIANMVDGGTIRSHIQSQQTSPCAHQRCGHALSCSGRTPWCSFPWQFSASRTRNQDVISINKYVNELYILSYGNHFSLHPKLPSQARNFCNNPFTEDFGCSASWKCRDRVVICIKHT